MEDMNMKSTHPLVLRLGVWLAPLLFTCAGFAQDGGLIPPDEQFGERRDAIIREMAGRFERRTDFGDRDFVRFGFETMHLMAKLEENRRGLGEGTTIARERAHLRYMTDTLVKNLGTPDVPGPWSWSRSGSPAMKHAALAFGYILHQWGDEMSADVRDNIRKAFLESTWQDDPSVYLVNGRLSVMAGGLLAGEYFGTDSELWEKAVREWDTMYNRAMSHGGLEMNAPIYTSYHFVPLTLLQKLTNEEYRNKARILCDYNLIVHGHLYMPGGGVGAPRSRDRSGAIKANGSLTRMFAQFFGEPSLRKEASDHSVHQLLAIGDYQPEETIRSLFLDKGNGYSFWCYTDAPMDGPKPHTVYELGPQRVQVAPWQAVFAPAGDVMMGMNHGFRYQAIHVSMGIWARDADGRFHVLYQGQPYVRGDTTDIPSRSLPSTSSTSPDDWLNEGYDFERLMHGRTAISLWNPTLEHKPPGVKRTHQDTHVHLPNYGRAGGELIEAGDWFVGRMGSTYIAYRPLGPIAERENRDEGQVIYLRLEGKSGGIYELATTQQFATIEAYAEDLQKRHFRFDREGLGVEFDGLDPASTEKVRLRLEYRPERRFIGGRDVTMSDVDRGFIDSPWVQWDAQNRVMTLARKGYPTLVYDIPNASIERSGPAPLAVGQ